MYTKLTKKTIPSLPYEPADKDVFLIENTW